MFMVNVHKVVKEKGGGAGMPADYGIDLNGNGFSFVLGSSFL